MSLAAKPRLFAAVIIAIVLTAAFGRPIWANGGFPESEYNTSAPIDISDGVFAGLNAEFFFALPNEWYDNFGNPLVEVTRITYSGDLNVLDCFDIDYIGPQTRMRVLRLFVFNRALWRDEEYPLSVVLKTNSYVFAVMPGEYIPYSPYSIESDTFNRMLDAVSTDAQLLRCVTLASGHSRELEYAVIVDAEILPSPIEIVNDVFYIPLREACDVFGYTILWSDTDKKITITHNEEVLDEFSLSVEFGHKLFPKFGVLIIKDRVYAVPAYFAGVLRKNAQKDDTNNVIITSRYGL